MKDYIYNGYPNNEQVPSALLKEVVEKVRHAAITPKRLRAVIETMPSRMETAISSNSVCIHRFLTLYRTKPNGIISSLVKDLPISFVRRSLISALLMNASTSIWASEGMGNVSSSKGKLTRAMSIR